MTSPKNITLYCNLLLNKEDWLIRRILNYAKKYEYTKYTSTLQEAWRLSISGLSSSLIKASEKFEFIIPEMHPDEKFSQDPVSDFGLMEARKHRNRGVTLAMFMGLMKYYRQTYRDLFNVSDLNKFDKNYFNLFTERCFDRIEISYANEWSMFNEKELIEEMQNTNLHLTNEKNKYLTIFEGFYSPLIVLDSDNKIVNINLAASQLFTDLHIAGSIYYNEEITKKEIVELNEHLGNFIKSSLNELAYETFMQTKLGERFFLVKLKKMLDISDKFRGTVIILDDLTDRKEMEHQFEIAKTKAEEADKLKTAFLANMSHEIRTPMNAIIGFSDLLLQENFDSKQKEYLKLIQKSGNNLLKLIDDIIDIAKIESKQLKIKIKDCNISELLKELYSIFNELLKKERKEDIELKLITDSLDINHILTDPERLKQVLSNLLSNSLKFTESGFIEFGFKSMNKKNLVFFVKDTGIGIPRDKLENIFDRFYQIVDNYTKDYGGTGLGLSISKNIINLLGGNIWVESELNIGSTFYFTIPFDNNYDYNSLKTKPITLKSDNFQNLFLVNNKILIAEDEEINFYYLNEILRKTGVNVIWAKNGLEAINLTESNPDIDLVLMDIKMPEINGLEAIRYIKTIRPELPIVAQTAFVMDNDKDICLKAGCIDFLSKPIKKMQLLEVISKLLNSEKKHLYEEPLKRRG